MKNSTKSAALAAVLSVCMGNVALAADPSHLEMKHAAGAFMFEYQYMSMNMSGLIQGTEVDPSMVKGSPYMNWPDDMTMTMHMLMPMYNITRDLSVMAMFNYIDNHMNMKHDMIHSGMNMGKLMEVHSIGDTVFNASYKMMNDTLALSMDLSVPTGATDLTMTHDHGGMSMEMKLPYAMQTGSGTYDLTPAATYLGAYYEMRYGGQVSYTYRIGENDSGYTLGNKATAKAWARYPLAGVMFTAGVDVVRSGAIKGEHKDYTMMDKNMSPTFRTSNYGGWLAEGKFGGSTFVGPVTVDVDLSYPVYQDAYGIQMNRGLTYALSASFML